MIDIQARRRGDSEMEHIKKLLSGIGVAWEQRGEGTPIVKFNNGIGECWVFPSQTYDGKLCVRFTRKELVETAEDAIMACGVFPYQDQLPY